MAKEDNNWSAFQKVAENFHSCNYTVIWRGQADVNWSLRPSIARLLPDPCVVDEAEKEIKRFEDEQYEDFKLNYRLFADSRVTVNNCGSKLQAWTAMQHFGFPTRLLDWTTNPYVAAYFAASDNLCGNGVVYAYSLGRKELKSIEEEDIQPGQIWAIPALFPTWRAVAQASAFTICDSPIADHGQLLANQCRRHLSSNEFLQFRIPSDIKGQFMHRLRCFNISGRMLFRDLEGLAKDSHEKLAMKVIPARSRLKAVNVSTYLQENGDERR